jgi:hypothetical protein
VNEKESQSERGQSVSQKESRTDFITQSDFASQHTQPLLASTFFSSPHSCFRYTAFILIPIPHYTQALPLPRFPLPSPTVTRAVSSSSSDFSHEGCSLWLNLQLFKISFISFMFIALIAAIICYESMNDLNRFVHFIIFVLAPHPLPPLHHHYHHQYSPCMHSCALL